MLRALGTASGSVETLSTLLGLVDEAVVIVDKDCLIAGWSSGAEELFDYDASEVLGRCCTEIYADDEGATHKRRCQEVLLGTSPAEFEATIKTRSGELHLAQVKLQPILNKGGVLGGLLSSIRVGPELSSRPNVTRSQARELWKILEDAPIVFSHLDANRRFLYLNKAGIDQIPTGGRQVVGRHLREVLGEARYQEILPQVDRVLAGEEAFSELSVQMPDGQTHYFYRRLYPQRAANGSIKGYFSVMLDVTPAKITQEDRLRREHVLRSTLIREINHRIKNSLQGIVGMMRLQATHSTEPAKVIDQCVAQLMAVAVAFGLASRHGEARILLCDMVLDIAHNVEQVSQRRIQVELSPATVRRPVALSELHGANISLVINELIYNAIKHCPTVSGPRRVTVYVDRDENSATFRVNNEAGRLPSGFSLDDGKGLGTGLSLLKVLIPPDSCDLKISQRPNGVEANLTLRSPVLSLEVGALTP